MNVLDDLGRAHGNIDDLLDNFTFDEYYFDSYEGSPMKNKLE
jgi:hypothetical protein